ncbi:hypothetical protein [Candidatus Methylobacter favarea]|uniref:hypothetical protein n=1 Tax=Candidatus Methylobacter favarea TaxID=2707345 RepID=UPI00157D7F7D|nr:hypothetical protein [Candidatus Methylobacter favarea]
MAIHESRQVRDKSRQKLDKKVADQQDGKRRSLMFTNMIDIKSVAGSVACLMVICKATEHFAMTHARCAVAPAIAIDQLFFWPGWNESRAKISYIIKSLFIS